MIEPVAKSKVVEGNIVLIIVAKSKDYSIYSHMYGCLNVSLIFFKRSEKGDY